MEESVLVRSCPFSEFHYGALMAVRWTLVLRSPSLTKMSNTDTVTGDVVLTTVAEAKAEKGSKSETEEEEENGNRILNMFILPSRARGLDCEDMFLTNLPKATILSITRKSILKMFHVNKWVPALGYFGHTSMNARYMT